MSKAEEVGKLPFSKSVAPGVTGENNLPRQRWLSLRCGGSALLLLSIVVLVGNHFATRFLESERFRGLLNRETSKGLKLQANYAPLRRVGLLGIAADDFRGIAGNRTIVSMQAEGITGQFDPLGLALRRWQIDAIRIRQGTVKLQKTEPIPGAPKGPTPIPWTALFWPYRVYLQDVQVSAANVLFQVKGREAGVYQTFLEITPNGRDFEYDARGGELRTPLSPTLVVQHLHLLIRKPRLYCPEMVLADATGHLLQIEGDAGLQDDRSMQLHADSHDLALAPWLPDSIRRYVRGTVQGHIDYQNAGVALSTAEMQGRCALDQLALINYPLMRKAMEITASPNSGANLPIDICQMSFTTQDGVTTIQHILVQSKGIFRVEGSFRVAQDQHLAGELALGLSAPYLNWLPRARETIFNERRGEYHFTQVHLGGTVQHPKEDLSGRVLHQVETSPLTAVKLFFRSATAN